MTDTKSEKRFLLVKRDLYEMPEHHGYTGIKDLAGRFYETDAAPDHGVVAIHEDDAPEFTKACFEDLKLAHIQGKLTAAQAEIERLKSFVEPRPFSEAPEVRGSVIAYREDAGWFEAEFAPAYDADGEETEEWYWWSFGGQDLSGDLPTHYIPELPTPPPSQSQEAGESPATPQKEE